MMCGTNWDVESWEGGAVMNVGRCVGFLVKEDQIGSLQLDINLAH
jgi:hypothetical protein